MGLFGIDWFGSEYAADQQADAQRQALYQQQQLSQQAQETFLEQSQLGIGYLDEANQRGYASLQDANRLGQGAIEQGRFQSEQALQGARGQQLRALGAGYDQARGDIAGGYNQGRADMAAGYGQARGDLAQLQGLQGYGQGATQSVGAYNVMGSQDRVGRMLDQPGGMYGGFQADPGYQFRQQQGEDAIGRAAAARGGRLSGRTLQELGEFNSGLASQEFGNYAARQQAQAGMAAGSDAQRAALLQNQAGRSDQAALAAQGNQMGLAQMGYGAQGQLAGLASQYGQGQAGMSVGGGQALGGMAMGYGGQQAGVYGQHGQNMANLYGSTYGQQANLYGQTGSNLANLHSSTGSNMANVAIGVGGNAQANAQNMMGAYANYANYGGMTEQAAANQNQQLFGAGLTALAAFSDSRLKSDIEVIHGSKFELIGLRGYRWKWNEAAELTGLKGESEGVIAQEVREKYPEAVTERSGWLAVDYLMLGHLIDKARAAAEAPGGSI